MTRKRTGLATLTLLAFGTILVPFAEARYYHPTLGRFINRDPNEYSEGLNLYNYTGNNPILLTDPTGGCSGSPPNVDYCTVQDVIVTNKGAFTEPPGLYLPGWLGWQFEVDIEICGNPEMCTFTQEVDSIRAYGKGYARRVIPYTGVDRGIAKLIQALGQSYTRLDGDKGTMSYTDTPKIPLHRGSGSYLDETMTIRITDSNGTPTERKVESGKISYPPGWVPEEVIMIDYLKQRAAEQQQPQP